MKELTLEEVLRIAGGVPLPAALDEITYRGLDEPPRDSSERTRLLGVVPNRSDPE